MRILNGTKVTEAPPSWRDGVERDARPVVIDLGAGDGRWVYDCARADPSHYYIAVDPDSDALSESAFRASRKPARGGVDNAAFVIASVERLPPDLQGLAARLRINFPWGSLLRAFLQPDPAILRSVAGLATPEGAFEVVFSYHPDHDTNAFIGDPVPPLEIRYIESVLAPAWGEAGLHVTLHHRLTQDEALAIPSSWGRRLLHARPRDVYYVAGSVSPPADPLT
jgi:16S rRNA (adenine(1408)-N(1))-methyltransferase